MIISSNVLNLSEQSSGRFRCTFNYVLNDGREINIKPASVGIDYQAVCEARALSVFDSVVKSDAEEAVSLGIKTTHGYAPQNNVFYEYLSAGYNAPDPIKAYDLMNGVAQPLLSLGLTTEELAAMLGEEVEVAQSVIDRWTLLSTNESTIEAYRVLQGELNG